MSMPFARFLRVVRFAVVIDDIGKRTCEPLFWSMKIAHISASPCLMFGFPLAGIPTEVHAASRPWFQPLLFESQEEVLSTMNRTFGTWAAMFGLVVKRSVSSPTRSMPTAMAQPQPARSAANSAVCRRRWSLFMLFSLYLFPLLAVSCRKPHLEALVDLG